MYDIALVAAALLMRIGECYPRTLHDAIYCADAIVEAYYGRRLVAAHAKRLGDHFFYSALRDLLVVDKSGLLGRRGEDRLASAARARRPYEMDKRYMDVLDMVAHRARQSRDRTAAEVERVRVRAERFFIENPPALRITVEEIDDEDRFFHGRAASAPSCGSQEASSVSMTILRST